MAESMSDVHSVEQHFDTKTLADYYRYIKVTVERGWGTQSLRIPHRKFSKMSNHTFVLLFDYYNLMQQLI